MPRRKQPVKRARRAPGTGHIKARANGAFQARYPRAGGGHLTKDCATLSEAEKWLDTLLARKRQKLVVAGGHVRLSELLASWLDTITVRRGLKPTTQSDYQYKLELWGDLADYTLSELEERPDLVDAAETALITAGTAETTVRQARSLLSRALDDARRKRFIAFNPATPERRARKHHHAPHRMSAASARLLCQTAQAMSQFYAAAFPLFLCCGLRSGELCGLRRSDVDFEACTLSIVQAIADVRGVPTVQTPKTLTSARIIPFPRALVPLLTAHLERLERRTQHGLRRGTWEEHDYVFPGKSGKSLSPISMRHALKDVTDTASLPPYTVHELRHSCGGFLEGVGAPEYIIAGLFGHTPVQLC